MAHTRTHLKERPQCRNPTRNVLPQKVQGALGRLLAGGKLVGEVHHVLFVWMGMQLHQYLLLQTLVSQICGKPWFPITLQAQNTIAEVGWIPGPMEQVGKSRQNRKFSMASSSRPYLLRMPVSTTQGRGARGTDFGITLRGPLGSHLPGFMP